LKIPAFPPEFFVPIAELDLIVTYLLTRFSSNKRGPLLTYQDVGYHTPKDTPKDYNLRGHFVLTILQRVGQEEFHVFWHVRSWKTLNINNICNWPFSFAQATGREKSIRIDCKNKCSYPTSTISGKPNLSVQVLTWSINPETLLDPFFQLDQLV